MAAPVPDLGKRIRAARAYADYSMPKLAEAVEVGRNTQWRSEKGKRTPKPGELRQIAHVCGVPVEFFYADFDRLSDITPPDAGAKFQRELEDASPTSQQPKRGNELAGHARGKAGP